MNNLIICMIVASILGLISIFLIFKLFKNKKLSFRIFTSLGSLILVLFLGLIVSFCMYYRADDLALTYMESTTTVTVTDTDNGYYFDGPGTDTVLLFFPGALVDSRAYAPMLSKLAEQGIDCFIPNSPIHMVMPNSCDEFVSHHQYKETYTGGHSFGGVVSANYTSKRDDISGIIFLASYPNVNLDNNLKCLSLYGSNDTVLNMKEYRANITNFPSSFKETMISGGNHAQFGYYGAQNGDGDASISHKEQTEITVSRIIDLINE